LIGLKESRVVLEESNGHDLNELNVTVTQIYQIVKIGDQH